MQSIPYAWIRMVSRITPFMTPESSSKATLQAHVGHSVDYFVYPSGEPFRSGTADRQAQVVQMLKNAGYRGALLDNNGYGAQDPAHPGTS